MWRWSWSFYSLRVNIHDEQINHLRFIDDLWSTCLLGISAFHWCHDITYLFQFTTRYLGFLICNYWFLQNDIILRRFITVSFFRMILNWEFTRFTCLLEINFFHYCLVFRTYNVVWFCLLCGLLQQGVSVFEIFIFAHSHLLFYAPLRSSWIWSFWYQEWWHNLPSSV